MRLDFPSFIPLRQIVLGLDLQGGAYLLMEVDTPSVTKSQIEALRDDVQAETARGQDRNIRRHRG